MRVTLPFTDLVQYYNFFNFQFNFNCVFMRNVVLINRYPDLFFDLLCSNISIKDWKEICRKEIYRSQVKDKFEFECVLRRILPNAREMALVNFSLPYQSVTMAPFLYAGSTEGYTTANSLRLNTALPSGSTISYAERENFHNEPYTPPIRFHQHQRSQFTQQKNHEIYTEHTTFSTQGTHYNVYNQDFRRTQPRQQQQHMRPPSLPSSFQYQQSPERIKPRIEEQQNHPEKPIG